MYVNDKRVVMTFRTFWSELKNRINSFVSQNKLD